MREAKRLSLEAAAKLIHLTAGALGRYETGERELGVPTLERLAVAYDVEPQDLLNSGDPARSVRERTLVAIYRRMRAADQERLLRLATVLAEEHAEPRVRSSS